MSIEKRNPEVTKFLQDLNHPLIAEIDTLRKVILDTCDLTENIKWNGPNYCDKDNDRITMRIQPPKQIQLIFHRGAKKLAQPKNKLIHDPSGLLIWKENDRAVASFKTVADIENRYMFLQEIIKNWILATR